MSLQQRWMFLILKLLIKYLRSFVMGKGFIGLIVRPDQTCAVAVAFAIIKAIISSPQLPQGLECNGGRHLMKGVL
jgi:hypothetical protein